MPELDFSKIFGETATSKASFTDENYLNGWGYLGSTPPPYQLFDYLQSLNDKKSKYLYDNINENKNNLLAHNTDSSAHTAILNAHNADINAHSPITEMIGKILGATNWQENPADNLKNIKNILGFGGIVAQRLETNGYVKFANGFTIQWGYDNVNSGDATRWTNYSVAFETAPIVVAGIAGGYSDGIVVTSTSNVGFERISFQNFNTTARLTRPCHWVAFGK